ncbi:hypothetical protein GY45DRAFT_560369 [Cubamyces sp. BRFM 1775]|nr:hypothetical protein GY45DRAFT_560369 [Cubamyces sp. BRFM 1775]
MSMGSKAFARYAWSNAGYSILEVAQPAMRRCVDVSSVIPPLPHSLVDLRSLPNPRVFCASVKDPSDLSRTVVVLEHIGQVVYTLSRSCSLVLPRGLLYMCLEKTCCPVPRIELNRAPSVALVSTPTALGGKRRRRIRGGLAAAATEVRTSGSVPRRFEPSGFCKVLRRAATRRAHRFILSYQAHANRHRPGIGCASPPGFSRDAGTGGRDRGRGR